MRYKAPMLAAQLRPLAALAASALLFFVFCFYAAPVRASEDEDEVELHLITMGPASHLYTAGGHAALMVAILDDGQPNPAQTTVYNFGDADYDDPSLKWRFVRGDAELRLTIIGTLQETVEDYGLRQGREVWHQRLNLSPAEARVAAARLAELARPENRYYRHHYHDATCTTKIRDLLDEVTGGALRRDLAGRPAEWTTARSYQPYIFANHPLVTLAGDLFMGRRHDQPQDKLWWLVDVPQMRTYLQEVTVTSVSGEPVPLAEPPEPLIEYVGTREEAMRTWITQLVVGLWILALGLGARRALRGLPGDRTAAGLWLILSGLFSGLVGAVIVILLAVSTMPEFRENENLLLFPATDLLLVAIGARWWRGPLSPGLARLLARLLAIYAWGRVALVALVVALQISGVFFQEPRLLIAISGFMAACLVALARRARDDA